MPIVFELQVAILVISAVSLPFGFSAAYFSFKQLKSAHMNLQIMNMFHCLCYMLIPVTTIVQYVLVMLGLTRSNTVFDVVALIKGSLPAIIVWMGIGMSLERTFATVKSENYENLKARWLCPCIICFVFAVVVGEICFNRYATTGIGTTIASYTTTGLNVFIRMFSVFVLFWANVRHRQTNRRHHFSLSDQFQTVENIKMLKLLIPQSMIDVLFGFVATVAAYFSRQVYPDYGTIIYFMVYNLYVIMTAVYWMLLHYECCNFDRIILRLINGPARVRPIPAATHGTVRMALGAVVEGQVSIEGHFVILRHLWHRH